MGLKERVRVRVISVRGWDHILPDMGEHQGLPGVLPQRTVHLLHRALCSSTCGAIAGWGVHYYRVCSVLAHAATPAFLKLFQVLLNISAGVFL